MNRFESSRLKSVINSLLESQKNVALCLYVVCLISPMCDFFIPVQMTKKIVDASTIFTTKRNIRNNLCIVKYSTIWIPFLLCHCLSGRFFDCMLSFFLPYILFVCNQFGSLLFSFRVTMTKKKKHKTLKK